jgi:hypothetical protein
VTDDEALEAILGAPEVDLYPTDDVMGEQVLVESTSAERTVLLCRPEYLPHLRAVVDKLRGPGRESGPPPAGGAEA